MPREAKALLFDIATAAERIVRFTGNKEFTDYTASSHLVG